jgi:60 kDa SS-A/Ro ribonucleoprotein
MSIDYLKNATKNTQADIQPGQIANSCGAAVWGVDDFTRLERFLILGAEGGSYYATEQKLTKENAQAVQRAIKADGLRVVRTIVEISDAGRAPKNDPAIFALALCAKLGDEDTRAAAYKAVPAVCRIGTHLYHFVAFCESVQGGGGWGRGMRRAVGNWFNEKAPNDLAYQLVKYQARDGWSSRDLLRLAHPTPKTESHKALYRWATQGADATLSDGLILPPVVEAFEEAKTVDDLGRMLKLITDYRLPREAIPTQWLTKPEVWNALLPHMGLTAMIRNLATMTRVGLIAPLSETTKHVVNQLGDGVALRKSRIHPIQVVAALLTYKSGRSTRGTSTWAPVGAINNALDAAFYQTFQNVVPTGKNTLLALDVSGSMEGGEIAGIPGLSPRAGSAVMALVTAAVEPNYEVMGFSSGFIKIDISPRMRLDDVLRKVSGLPFDYTDCSLPMRWARENKVPVESFQVYTDSDTNAYGKAQPADELRLYRRTMVSNAKLTVVGMISNGFTIADPKDPGMLDVVGFDTNAPAVIADFVRGARAGESTSTGEEIPTETE